MDIVLEHLQATYPARDRGPKGEGGSVVFVALGSEVESVGVGVVLRSGNSLGTEDGTMIEKFDNGGALKACLISALSWLLRPPALFLFFLS